VALSISDVLNRRSDLSTFVVHLTRDHGAEDSARSRLEKIINDRRLIVGDPRGWATGVREAGELVLTPEQRETQRVVCFSETPLEHAYSLFAEIENRSYRLRPYGLALTKMVARRAGINPIWYVDISQGHPWAIRNALNRLVTKSVTEGWFNDVRALFPAIEGMLTRTDEEGKITFQREFWWEREWRHVGDVPLAPIWSKILWLCPEAEMDEISALVRDVGETEHAFCVDPNWGLERIIGHLIELGVNDLTPFSSG
jgi:hypothetical protein